MTNEPADSALAAPGSGDNVLSAEATGLEAEGACGCSAGSPDELVCWFDVAADAAFVDGASADGKAAPCAHPARARSGISAAIAMSFFTVPPSFRRDVDWVAGYL